MDTPLERSLSIIMDKSLERSLSIIVGGYIFSFGAYLVWCFYFFYGKPFKVDYFFIIGLVFFAITAVYLFSYLLISYIKSLQKVWASFFLVLIITLLVFLLIPSTGNSIYTFNLKRDKTIKTIKMNKQLEVAKENTHTEQKRMKVIESKLNNSHEINDVENKSIPKLQAKMEYGHKENDELRKKINETIRKTKSLEEEQKTKGSDVVQAKSKKDLSEIEVNSEAGNTDFETKNQEIIFKIQIISSSTRLSANSPQFKGLKDVWEYKDKGLYKYTVGNQKDLKSASVLQSECRSKGFAGAFVVAFKNGKRITVRDARKLLAAY
jgi:hypothetical protein